MGSPRDLVAGLPTRLRGAEKELGSFHGEVSRLPRLQGWLDHLISWGGNGPLLGPIFTPASHGYDTVDYFQIDPRLGDDADFDALVAACRDRVCACCLMVSSTMWAGSSRRWRRHWLKDQDRRAEDWVSLRHRRCDHCRLLRGPPQSHYPQSQLEEGAGVRA